MISILVTGATTPIGEALIRTLRSDPRVDHILAVGIEEPELPPSLKAVDRLTYLATDLSRPRLVRQLVFGPAADLGVSVVVHLAQHRRMHARGRQVHQLNVEALRTMLDLAADHPTLRRVVVKSYAEVYKTSLDLPTLVTETHPLDFGGGRPQAARDRLEADLTACARMGEAGYDIVVLRCAEALAAGTGSQLYDYLNAPVALRPLGFDPMLNVATVEDLVSALEKAIFATVRGVFNIPGYDTLPLSACVRRWGTRSVVLPGPMLRSLYELRRKVTGHDFSYLANWRRLHYGLMLDGSRARAQLGYLPSYPVDWPVGGAVYRET